MYTKITAASCSHTTSAQQFELYTRVLNKTVAERHCNKSVMVPLSFATEVPLELGHEDDLDDRDVGCPVTKWTAGRHPSGLARSSTYVKPR